MPTYNVVLTNNVSFKDAQGGTVVRNALSVTSTVTTNASNVVTSWIVGSTNYAIDLSTLQSTGSGNAKTYTVSFGFGKGSKTIKADNILQGTFPYLTTESGTAVAGLLLDPSKGTAFSKLGVLAAPLIRLFYNATTGLRFSFLPGDSNSTFEYFQMNMNVTVNVCFHPSTKIETTEGFVSLTDLREDHIVITPNGPKPILFITRGLYNLNPVDGHIRDSFYRYDLLDGRTLTVTGGHRIGIDQTLIQSLGSEFPGVHSINDTKMILAHDDPRAKRLDVEGLHPVVHLCLDIPQTKTCVNAEGLWVETLDRPDNY